MSSEDGTHEAEWESPYKLGAWPDDAAGPEAWVGYALRLLANEVDCIIHHLDRGGRGEDFSDYFDAAMHMGNVAEGVQNTAQAIFAELLNDEERIAVTMNLMEKKLGVPLKVKESEDGRFVMIVPDTVVVPDNLSGLTGDGTP